MVLALPYDIWCLIAKFIPKPELLRLYGVNSAFFDSVMNEEYREIRIYHIADENTRRCLKNMSPAVATRVRSLILRPRFFGRLPNSDSVSFSGKLLNYFRRTGKPFKSSTLLQHISCMTEVKSLTIECYRSDDFRLFNLNSATLITTAWSAQGSRLRSLSLSIPLEAYPKIIVAGPVLESLENLNITLRVVYLTTMYEEIYPLIITFIARHSRTLHTLSVHTPDTMVNPYHFFHNLDRLPNLERLTIHHPLNRLRPQYPSGIDSFLKKHANQLKELSFLICDILATFIQPTPDELFSHPIFQVPMPHLTSLELGLLQWTGAIHRDSMAQNFMKYLRPMRKTLSRFALRNHALTFPEIQCIALVLGGIQSQVRSLEIHTYFLTCDLFDLLSQRLPRLHHLEVGFEALKKGDGDINIPNYPNHYYWPWSMAGPDPRASEFLQGMAIRIYSDWTLRHLKFPTYYCSGKWDETRAVLVVALPSVITFNGLSADEFVKTPDYTKPY